MPRYILVKTHGRGVTHAPIHIPDNDGYPVCGVAIENEQWELWPHHPGTLYGRQVCQNCRKHYYNSKDYIDEPQST